MASRAAFRVCAPAETGCGVRAGGAPRVESCVRASHEFRNRGMPLAVLRRSAFAKSQALARWASAGTSRCGYASARRWAKLRRSDQVRTGPTHGKPSATAGSSGGSGGPERSASAGSSGQASEARSVFFSVSVSVSVSVCPSLWSVATPSPRRLSPPSPRARRRERCSSASSSRRASRYRRCRSCFVGSSCEADCQRSQLWAVRAPVLGSSSISRTAINSFRWPMGRPVDPARCLRLTHCPCGFWSLPSQSMTTHVQRTASEESSMVLLCFGAKASTRAQAFIPSSPPPQPRPEASPHRTQARRR